MKLALAVAVAVLLVLGACRNKRDGGEPAAPSTARAPAPVAPTSSATPAAAPSSPEPAMNDLQSRIARDLAARSERPPANEPPTRAADGSWRSPDGGALEKVYVVSWSRPPEEDGVPTTAYYEPAKKRYWLHEGGGLSVGDDWFGPFPLPGP